MRFIVKYGGTALATGKKIRNVAGFVASQAEKHDLVVVCSALSGITDELLDIAAKVKSGNGREVKSITSRIVSRHKKLAASAAVKSKAKLLKSLKSDFDELGELVDGLALLGEITPRSMDYLMSFGERLSIKLVAAAIRDAGAKAQQMTGAEIGIITDSNFGEARPLMDTTRLRISRNMAKVRESGIIPVVGGFAGADQHGSITTFGRGGSDYTATIIGSCINADEIWLMTDVDGLMTADPKTVHGAIVLSEVSYAEAIEMALFGAKQIHPRTFEPLLAKKIPMRIRSSINTDNAGTLVTPSPGPETKKTVKCVCVIRHNGLVDIMGGSMVGAPGTAAKIFSALARVGINVMMISQNPSESSISIIVKNADLERAVSVLETDLLGSIIKKVEVTTDVAIVALIGSGMRGTVGVASRVFGAIARNGINVTMITQGSSELNLAFVVRDNDAESAAFALHQEFELASIN